MIYIRQTCLLQVCPMTIETYCQCGLLVWIWDLPTIAISRPTNEAADSYTVSLRSSKGWDWAKTKLSVNATYKHLDSPLLIQDQIVRYLSNSSHLSMSLYAMPLHWMAIDYSNSWYIIKSRMKLGSSVPTQNTFKSKLAFNFFIAKALSLNMNFKNNI